VFKELTDNEAGIRKGTDADEVLVMLWKACRHSLPCSRFVAGCEGMLSGAAGYGGKEGLKVHQIQCGTCGKKVSWSSATLDGETCMGGMVVKAVIPENMHEQWIATMKKVVTKEVPVPELVEALAGVGIVLPPVDADRKEKQRKKRERSPASVGALDGSQTARQSWLARRPRSKSKSSSFDLVAPASPKRLRSILEFFGKPKTSTNTVESSGEASTDEGSPISQMKAEWADRMVSLLLGEGKTNATLEYEEERMALAMAMVEEWMGKPTKEVVECGTQSECMNTFIDSAVQADGIREDQPTKEEGKKKQPRKKTAGKKRKEPTASPRPTVSPQPASTSQPTVSHQPAATSQPAATNQPATTDQPQTTPTQPPQSMKKVGEVKVLARPPLPTKRCEHVPSQREKVTHDLTFAALVKRGVVSPAMAKTTVDTVVQAYVELVQGPSVLKGTVPRAMQVGAVYFRGIPYGSFQATRNRLRNIGIPPAWIKSVFFFGPVLEVISPLDKIPGLVRKITASGLVKKVDFDPLNLNLLSSWKHKDGEGDRLSAAKKIAVANRRRMIAGLRGAAREEGCRLLEALQGRINDLEKAGVRKNGRARKVQFVPESDGFTRLVKVPKKQDEKQVC